MSAEKGKSQYVIRTKKLISRSIFSLENFIPEIEAKMVNVSDLGTGGRTDRLRKYWSYICVGTLDLVATTYHGTFIRW